MNIVRFQINIPVQVALASPRGELIQGRYGDRILFHLTDERIMYVPPFVATMIDEQAIVPQEPFELCKTELKNGRRRSIEWALKRIDPEPPRGGVEGATSEPETPLERDLRVSTELANARKTANKEPQAITVISDDAIPPFAPIGNGNGAAIQNGNNQPLPSTKLEHALKTAISAAYNAEKYGTELGYVVRFDADAIKSMAITVLINMSEGGPEMIQVASNGTTPAMDADLGAVLSPSQVRCFMECQTRWWFKYGLKHPDPPTGSLALGRAVHASLGYNFAQKVETYQDLPTAGVQALFRESWALECGQVEFRDDENPAQFAAIGESLVAKYMHEMAPLIEPVAVELRVEGEIGGVRVQGWIDILDTDGRVVDIKTARARPSSIEPMYRFQAATYCRLTPGASGKGRIDTLVKSKIPQVTSQSFELTEADLAATQSLYPLIQDAMRANIHVPNRLALTCSRRSCAFWRNCESEWGGEVPER